jgi:hypothetical protein
MSKNALLVFLVFSYPVISKIANGKTTMWIILFIQSIPYIKHGLALSSQKLVQAEYIMI